MDWILVSSMDWVDLGVGDGDWVWLSLMGSTTLKVGDGGSMDLVGSMVSMV